MAENKKSGRASVSTVIKSILSGDILILMRVDRILPYILFLFLLGWVNIFLNYSIEQTMAKVEKNKKTLEYYRNEYADKTYEYVRSGNKSNIKQMLEKGGSEVTTPQKPAERIKIR
jgi:hypothetical protein